MSGIKGNFKNKVTPPSITLLPVPVLIIMLIIMVNHAMNDGSWLSYFLVLFLGGTLYFCFYAFFLLIRMHVSRVLGLVELQQECLGKALSNLFDNNEEANQ